MTEDLDKTVMSVVWPWRRRQSSSADTSAKELLRKSLIQGLVMMTVGAVVFFGFRHRLGASILLCLAAFVLISARLAPRLYSAFQRALDALVGWISTGITWLLLVPFFYLCFVPGRLLLLLLRRDPMRRRWPCPDSTCWQAHADLPEDHFKRQF